MLSIILPYHIIFLGWITDIIFSISALNLGNTVLLAELNILTELMDIVEYLLIGCSSGISGWSKSVLELILTEGITFIP